MSIKLYFLSSVLLVPVVSMAQNADKQWKGDRNFIENTMQHHRMGMQMAAMCLKKATHPELKQLCSKIDSEQQQDNREMGQLSLKAAEASHEESSNHPEDREHQQMHKMSDQMMSGLQAKSGDDFDREFLAAMLMHHQEAIAKATQCSASASNEKLKQLCSQMVHTQTAENEKMAKWSQQWFKQRQR